MDGRYRSGNGASGWSRNRGRRWLVRGRARRPIELKFTLDSIRDRLGDKWEKAAPSVRRFAAMVIERQLGPSGRVTRESDVFVLQFVGQQPRDAARTMRAIEAELNELLFGSEATADVGALMRRAKRNRWSSTRSRGPFARLLARLKGMLTPTRHEHVDVTARPTSEESDAQEPVLDAPATGSALSSNATLSADRAIRRSPLTSADPASTTALLSDSTQPWWTGDAVPEPAPKTALRQPNFQFSTGGVAASPDTSAELEFIVDPSAGAVIASSRRKGRVRRRGTDALERALYAAILDTERRNAAAQKTRVFPPMGTRFLYRPMWLVKHGNLPIHTCTPACALSPFEFVTGEALLTKDIGPRKIAMLDEMLLDHIACEVQQRVAMPLGTMICVPVHFETLTGERAAIYLRELGKIPSIVRRKMVVEIIGISQGVGQLSTYSLVRKLKAYVHTVTGRLDSGDFNFRVWRQTDLACVGVDLESDDRPEAEIMHDLNSFTTSARQHNLRTYVRGLRTFSLATAAVASGADLLDGPAVAEGDLVFPERARAFGLLDVYTSP